MDAVWTDNEANVALSIDFSLQRWCERRRGVNKKFLGGQPDNCHPCGKWKLRPWHTKANRWTVHDPDMRFLAIASVY